MRPDIDRPTYGVTTLAAVAPQPATLRWLDAALGSAAWVDAQPFRAHLHHLISVSGLHWRVVARYCGLPARTAQRLVLPAPAGPPDAIPPLRRITRVSAARLLGVQPAQLSAVLHGGTVPAAATRARLRALRLLGHEPDEIAEAVAADTATLCRVLSGRPAPRRCSRLLQLQVEAAWEHLTGGAEPDPGGL